MNGVIIGGWKYVLVAYSITIVVLWAWGLFVVCRYRSELRQRRRRNGASS